MFSFDLRGIGVERHLIEQSVELMATCPPLFQPDIKLSEWQINDSIDSLGKPHDTLPQSPAEYTADNIETALLDMFRDESVAHWPMDIAVDTSRHLLSSGLSDHDAVVGKCPYCGAPLGICSELNARIGIFIAHITKLEWFQTGHHVHHGKPKGIIGFAARAFEMDPAVMFLEENLYPLWRFAHFLDTRSACAALGIVPHFDKTCNLNRFLTGMQHNDEGDAEFFPFATTIPLKGDRVFTKLSNTRFVKYFQDKAGTVERLKKAYQAVKSDRAAFHPDAELLGKKYRQLDFSKQDKRVVSAIAYILFEPAELEKWRDILPQDEVLNEPVYKHLRNLQEEIRYNKESELKPCDPKFTYSSLTEPSVDSTIYGNSESRKSFLFEPHL